MRQRSATIRSGALGVLAGLVGGLCCLGPSAAILLGLGSSSALAGLAFERGLTLAAGLGLLAVGMVFAVRHARACALPGRASRRQVALMLLTFATAYGLLAYLLPVVAEHQADSAPVAVASAPVAQAATLRRATLIIAKMDCPPCAAHVRGLLRRKPYVHGFFAETNIDQVTIDYDSHQTSAQSIIRLFPQSMGIALIGDQALT